MPRVVLLEYIQDALPLDMFPALSSHHNRLLAVDGPDVDAGIHKQLWSRRVSHGDVGHRQVLVKCVRLTVLDFGCAMLTERNGTDEEWNWLLMTSACSDWPAWKSMAEGRPEVAMDEFQVLVW